jgi:endonuclease/exonuclease/phosphatase family metal-dependent hydrolase
LHASNPRHSRTVAVRIMTYNVHRCLGLDRKLSPQRVAEVIASCHPDIVALQELDVGRLRSGRVDQAETIARELGMELHFFPAVRILEEQFGDAILSRLPARLAKAGPLPGWRGAEPRGALWATIDAHGVDLQVLNTHLGLWGRERNRQIDALLGPEWLSHPACQAPVVLAGDFNAAPHSRGYRRLASQLTDAFRAAGGRPEPTFPTRYPALRLDHIFVSRSIDVFDVRTIRTPLSRFASDHLPVVAELGLSVVPQRQPAAAALDAAPAG